MLEELNALIKNEINDSYDDKCITYIIKNYPHIYNKIVLQANNMNKQYLEDDHYFLVSIFRLISITFKKNNSLENVDKVINDYISAYYKRQFKKSKYNIKRDSIPLVDNEMLKNDKYEEDVISTDDEGE